MSFMISFMVQVIFLMAGDVVSKPILKPVSSAGKASSESLSLIGTEFKSVSTW